MFHRLITGAAALFTFGPVVAAQDLDSWGAQISGLDPFIVLGMSGIIIAGGGWLCGPSVGSGMFSLWAKRRGWSQAIAEVRMIPSHVHCLKDSSHGVGNESSKALQGRQILGLRIVFADYEGNIEREDLLRPN